MKQIKRPTTRKGRILARLERIEKMMSENARQLANSKVDEINSSLSKKHDELNERLEMRTK